MNARARIGFFAVAALVAGCSSTPSSQDGGSDGGPTDGGLGFVDGGHKDGGSPGVDGGGDGGSGPTACASDSDCLSVGRRCSPDGGCTVPAASCDPSQGSSNCSGTSYCWIDGINTTHGCYCDPLPPSLDAGPGVCYVPIPPCGACVNQIDCGPSAQVDTPGYCGPVGSGNFCLPLDTGGSCPSAFVPGNVDNTDVCVPSCGTCPCTPCSSDADCPTPAAGVCNVQNGACEPPCQVQTDCVSGEVCNVLGKYLDPTVGAYYAAGECGAPCATTSDCAVYQAGVGLPYYCDLDAGAFCRPTGCIQDGECVGSGVSSTTVRAWCDISDGNVCTASGCRLGEDPMTSEPYTDCLGGYACFLPDGGTLGQEDGGALVLGGCVETPCNQVPGGGHTVCTAGQFCCGEGDAGTSCGGADAGQCYTAPSPPWCVSCDPSNGMLSNPACAGVNDGFPGAVACILARGIGNTTAWCGPACDPNSPWTCPSGWDCTQEGSGYNCITRNGCSDAG